MDSRKATGCDGIQPKLLKLAAHELTPSMTHMANNIIINSSFPHNMKLAEICPVFKKDNNMNKSKYRNVSILPVTSKIMEKVINKQYQDYFNNILVSQVSAYRQGYSTQTLLLSAVESWKHALDTKIHT